MTTKFLFTPIKTQRDLLLFETSNQEILTVSCDSSGGIGPKQLDKIKVDGYTLGKITARSAIMEVLAVNATPLLVVDTLSVEPEPTGKQILQGIKGEMIDANLNPQIALNGSSEKNIAVEQTGIGITVLGSCKKSELKTGTSQSGDVIVACGIPYVGYEVVEKEKERKMPNLKIIQKLRKQDFIHEIIPVGSTGISHEIKILAKESNLKAKIDRKSKIDIKKTAGPSTVILLSLQKRYFDDIIKITEIPLTIVGYLN